MRKFAVILCLAVIFAVPTVVLAQQTQTKNGTWTYNGYDCELWSQDNAGTTTMVLNGDNGTGANAKGGTFTAQWSKTINILFRCGRKFSTTSGGTISGREPPKPALDYGNISIDFAATWSSTDNVKMLGVYGWAFYAQGSIPNNYDKAIEYYIIQDRGSYNSATQGTNSTKKGSATIDGIAYDFYVCDRLGQNSISGNSVNFKQYFSVPQNTSSHRTSGTISVSKHFAEWAKVGMKMDGPLYEVALKVESYTGNNGNANGNATITKNILTVGGSTPSSSSAAVSSSSSKPSSSSAAVSSSSSKPSSSSAAVSSSSSKPSSSSVAVSSSSSRASSSSVASSSSRASSSSVAGSSSSNAATSSSSVASEASSSSEVEASSSSEEDLEPILKNRVPVTYFSIQPQSDKALRIEISSPAVVEIFDLKGNKVAKFNVSSTQQTVKLSSPSGVYFAKVRGMKSIRFVLK